MNPKVLARAVMYQRSRSGQGNWVVGRLDDVKAADPPAGMEDAHRELEIVNAANTQYLDTYKSYLYNRLQRKGSDSKDYTVLQHEIVNVFAAIDAGKWAWATVW